MQFCLNAPLLFPALKVLNPSAPFKHPPANVWVGLIRRRGPPDVQGILTPCPAFALTPDPFYLCWKLSTVRNMALILLFPPLFDQVVDIYFQLIFNHQAVSVGISFSFQASWTPSSSSLLVLNVLQSESSSQGAISSVLYTERDIYHFPRTWHNASVLEVQKLHWIFFLVTLLDPI